MPSDGRDGNFHGPTTARTLRAMQKATDNSQAGMMRKYRTELAASAASLTSTLIAYPLDSMKTRMQSYQFRGFVGCVQYTYKREGMNGFWRGVTAPLASITLVRTLSFSAYQKAKITYDDLMFQATGFSAIEHANRFGSLPNFGTFACFGAAGATSGALVTVISCPFELTKLNAQIELLMTDGPKDGAKQKPNFRPLPPPITKNFVPPKSIGTIGLLKLIYQKRGLAGLWTGYPYHLLRDTIGTGLYFLTYETSKQFMANARGEFSPASPYAVVVAGGLCGITSWACIYPIDSAKSIYQRNVLSSRTGKAAHVPINFFDRAMYRGLVVSMMRSCAVNAIFFSMFEFVKKRINRMEDDVGI